MARSTTRAALEAQGSRRCHAFIQAKATTDNDAYGASIKHSPAQGTGSNPNIDEVTKVP